MVGVELSAFFWKVLLAIAIGGLIGLEREKKEHHVIGFRSFALISFLGMMLTSITLNPLAVALALAGVFALAVLYYNQKTKHVESWGITTAIMLPMTFVLGALVGMDYLTEAAIAAVIAVFLLVEEKKVHAITERVSKDEILDLLLFMIIAFVIYPKLPTQPVFFLGQPFNLQFFWSMVVLITALSFGGFVLVKYVGGKALSLASFFGGFVSSLAVVAVMAEKAKTKPKLIAGVLAAAGAGSLTSDILLLAVIAPTLLPQVFPLLFSFFIAFALIAWAYTRKSGTHSFEQTSHPLSLKFITEFAVGFFLVNWLISWVAVNAPGQFALTSFAGGILSSTSVLASVAFLYNSGVVTQQQAVYSFLSALIGSLAAKVFVAGASTKHWNEYLKIGLAVLAVSAVGALLSLSFKFF